MFITYIGTFLVCPVSTNLGGFLFNLKTRIFQTYDHIAFPKKWVNRLKVDFELCHRETPGSRASEKYNTEKVSVEFYSCLEEP